MPVREKYTLSASSYYFLFCSARVLIPFPILNSWLRLGFFLWREMMNPCACFTLIRNWRNMQVCQIKYCKMHMEEWRWVGDGIFVFPQCIVTRFRSSQNQTALLLLCTGKDWLIRGLRGRGSSKIFKGRGSLKIFVHGCACQTPKFWLLLYLFFLHLPPISIPISYINHQILLKLDAFYHNLLKMHPIYVN